MCSGVRRCVVQFALFDHLTSPIVTKSWNYRMLVELPVTARLAIGPSGGNFHILVPGVLKDLGDYVSLYHTAPLDEPHSLYASVHGRNARNG